MTPEEQAETAYWLFVEVHTALIHGKSDALYLGTAALTRESFASIEGRRNVWLAVAALAGKWRPAGVDAAKDLYERIHGELGHLAKLVTPSGYDSMDYDNRCPGVRQAWREIARALERRAAQ